MQAESGISYRNWIASGLVGVLVAAALGCQGGAWRTPEPEPRGTHPVYAAEAAKRHPYPAHAPRGADLEARAEIAYQIDRAPNRLSIINLSPQTWRDVDIWVNQTYVMHMPVMEPKALKRINFNMFYDDRGNPMPRRGMLVTQLEVYLNGQIHPVTFKTAD